MIMDKRQLAKEIANACVMAKSFGWKAEKAEGRGMRLVQADNVVYGDYDLTAAQIIQFLDEFDEFITLAVDC